MPPTLLFSTWLWESAWFYIVLCAVLAAASPGVVFEPGATLVPYGIGMLVTLLLGGLWGALGPDPSQNPDLRSQNPESRVARTLMAIAVVMLELEACAVCLLGLTWWELYRSLPLLDRGWLELAQSDIRSSSAGFPGLAWLVASGVLLWWRGSSVSRQSGDFQGLVYRFIGGTVVLLMLSIFSADLPQSTSLSMPILAGYLLFGLMAMSDARLEAAGRERQGAVDRRWRRRSSAIALLLLAAGFGLAFLLLPALDRVVLDLANLVSNVLWPALMELLKLIAHLLGLDRPPEPIPTDPAGGPALSAGDRETLFSLSDELRALFRQLFNLSWVFIIVYSVFLWVRDWARRSRRPSTSGATREKIPWRWSPGAILSALLRGLLARWPNLSRWIGRAITAEDRAWTIRELYRRLQRWGAARGRRREPWATPWEYQSALSAEWPELKDAFQAITDGFLQARYGESEVKGEELDTATQEWQRISSVSKSPTIRISATTH